jgi:hypothetical protein
VLTYALIHLFGKEIEEAFGAEGGIMAGQGDNGRGFTAGAFHEGPQKTISAGISAYGGRLLLFTEREEYAKKEKV